MQRTLCFTKLRETPAFHENILADFRYQTNFNSDIVFLGILKNCFYSKQLGIDLALLELKTKLSCYFLIPWVPAGIEFCANIFAQSFHEPIPWTELAIFIILRGGGKIRGGYNLNHSATKGVQNNSACA